MGEFDEILSREDGDVDRAHVACIACRKVLRNIDPDGNQPSGGTAFVSYGHFGSTVFDPMDGTFLEINVCDGCLTAAGNAAIVQHGRSGGERRSTSFRPWVCHGRNDR